MRRRKFNFPVKALAIILIILLALCFILGYIWRILVSAEYFQVRDTLSNEVLSADLSYLKGKNIFSLDLPKEAARIAQSCPDCSRVMLARVFPDRIYVKFVRRKPLAFIKLYRYFAVDEEGVVFQSLIQPDDSGLAVITGLETKIFGLKLGNKYESRELAMALLILKEAARTRSLKDYRIQKVNVAGIDNITVQIPLLQAQSNYADWKPAEKKQFLEVKFGQGNIRDKVAIMSGLINQEKQNLNNIKYIDLRFNEPVIKFKDVK
ncbi:MAG: cell division protein FtsQ/DivIB [Candidatus Omnitrophica bacterium]|nr:cell division protein FtsQ/DivIB [Candidatus Omnitrophota bacterium]